MGRCRGIRIQVLDDILAWLEVQFEVFVIAMAVGIGLYFALSFEPKLLVLCGLLLLVGVLALLVGKRNAKLGFFIGLLFCAMFGLWRAGWHTAETYTPRFPSAERYHDVSGWISAIEKSGPRLRWVVKVRSINRIKKENLPEFIRVTTFNKDFRAGDQVSFRANLSAPPGPAIPAGYDPGFRAYFQKVGAYGYMVSTPETAYFDLTRRDKIRRTVTRIRYGMAERILTKAPEETAGLQVALLTGIRTWVPETQTLALRAGGLAHILAISGLHMGLIAGGFYTLAVLLFVRITRWSRRSDIRKPAAMIGILAATLYLVLSGASVATQRAYIMAVIVFLAIILDRQAISIRSVAVAGFITLWLHPESLVQPGFQMSFSAVTALVVVYREWDKRRVFDGPRKLPKRIWDNFMGLTVTSLVAGTATSGFAVLHFNRIASYSLITNIVAMPIFTFWVMPMAIVVYLAMPLGLEFGPLWLMGQGLELIIYASEKIQAVPGSIKYIASGPGWVIGVFGLAFTALCMGRARARIISVFVILTCWAMIWQHPQPDIRISESGAVAFWQTGDNPKLFVDRKNTDRYGRQQFIEAMGLSLVDTETFDGRLGSCDMIGCVLRFKDKTIKIIYDPSEFREDCAGADIVIFPKRRLGSRAKRQCAAMIIDAEDLDANGAYNLYLNDQGSLRTKTARLPRPGRPWLTGYRFR